MLPSAPIFENQAIEIFIIYLILSRYLKIRGFLLHFPREYHGAYQELHPSGKPTLETNSFQVHITLLIPGSANILRVYDFPKLPWGSKVKREKLETLLK